MTARSFSEIMKEEAKKLDGKTKEEPPVLSTEDQEIKQLEDRRKELRNKEDGSQREKMEHTELKKTVKKKRRQRSRKKQCHTHMLSHMRHPFTLGCSTQVGRVLQHKTSMICIIHKNTDFLPSI